MVVNKISIGYLTLCLYHCVGAAETPNNNNVTLFKSEPKGPTLGSRAILMKDIIAKLNEANNTGSFGPGNDPVQMKDIVDKVKGGGFHVIKVRHGPEGPNFDKLKEIFRTTTRAPRTNNVSFFESVLKSKVFVDHTYMIKDLVDNLPNDGKINVIPVPRGFGKSTNLDMLKRFFEITVDKTDGNKVKNKEDTENYKLFTDPKLKLRISKEPEFIQRYLGEYPIIHLDFGKMYENPAIGLSHRLQNVYDDYNLLCNGTLEKPNFPSGENETNLALVTQSLCDLARILSERFHHKIMLFIDNYDDPILNVIPCRFVLSRIYGIIGVMFLPLMKIMPQYADYIIVTGMTSLSKSYFVKREGLNISTHVFLENHFLTKYQGFTADEAVALFDQHNLTPEQRALVKENCNGYIAIDNITVLYNPTPVRKYLLSTKPDRESELMNYWPKTSVFVHDLYKFIKMFEVRDKLVNLLWCRREHMIVNVIDMWITELEKIQWLMEGKLQIDQGVKMLFSYLLDHGYLGHGGELNHYVIPNQEIVRELNHLLFTFYTTDIDMGRELFQATAESLYPILTQVNTTQEMINNFQKTLNELFVPFYRNRFIEDGRLNPNVIFEFETILYCAATLKFKHINGKTRIKPLAKQYVGRMAFGILSDDHKIMLLMQIKFRESVESSLNRICQHVPFYHEPRVVKYLGININGEFKAQIGSCPDYHVEN